MPSDMCVNEKWIKSKYLVNEKGKKITLNSGFGHRGSDRISAGRG